MNTEPIVFRDTEESINAGFEREAARIRKELGQEAEILFRHPTGKLTGKGVVVLSGGKGQSDCPMTVENCEKYGISDSQAERFCDKGCSVICSEEFRREFVERRAAE